MSKFDISFIGHMCYDEIVPYQGKTIIVPGSAVLCGAMVAARVNKKVGVITKMAKADLNITASMTKIGIDNYIIPARETTHMRVVHPSSDVDIREMTQVKNAGYIEIDELPVVDSDFVHFAGITNQEFTIELLKYLKEKDLCISADLQSFVRQVDRKTKKIIFQDVKNKVEIVKLLNKVKLDIVEAKILTGTADLEDSSKIIESWGCTEIIITSSEGVFARVDGVNYFEKFSNKSIIGRTGRGDTTFAAYLSRRMTHNPKESLKFAAVLVSIKMEKTGPFDDTLQNVLKRMKNYHQ